MKHYTCLKITRWTTPCLLAVALLGTGCSGVQVGAPFLAPVPFKEQPVVLPPYPAAAAFLPVPVRSVGTGFGYALDPGSVSRGTDGVMRYIVALTSASGVRNVFYEGLRCDTAQYRTYAFGSSTGRFRRIGHSRWRSVTRDGTGAYRWVLYREYLCDSYGLPRNPDAVRQRLRYPGSASVSDVP
ncbi:MAG: CNP1-like family protein [Gammaproteobacteria bacterium]|nr:CNP1-like family protein [Gammaproteobacteria bacterium]